MFILSAAVLVVTLVLTATGGMGRAVAALGSRVDGMVAGLTATPTPRAAVPVIPDPPTLQGPEEPYTNQLAVDIVVGLPPEVPGTGSVVRLRVGPDAATRTVVREVPVGATPTLVVPGVPLVEGRNDFTATIKGRAGESDPSGIVTWILDAVKPPITLLAPVEGQTINADMVTMRGQTQGRADVVARNGVNKASAATEADESGEFSVDLPLGKGANQLGLTVTDPAGNVATHLVSVIRGEGKLTAKLTTEPSGASVKGLPQPMKLTVVVTDPDEVPLEGAEVTFTLSVPGIQVVTSEAVTGAGGIAVFETTVPKGATPGEAVAAVLVRTEAHGETTASVELKLVE
jgi:hypothetical protein